MYELGPGPLASKLFIVQKIKRRLNAIVKTVNSELFSLTLLTRLLC